MSEPTPRWQVLAWAAALSRPVDEIKARLQLVPAPAPVVAAGGEADFAVVGRKQVVSILERFLGGVIEAGELEDWANLVEDNPEFRFETAWEPVLRRIVFEAANPALEGEAEPERVRGWLQNLAA
ncbi:MAG: hypothetical protein IT162_20770 [Bryobacterales bacterium]|nr:hypothetical protein [Bryobacterales bacterium]